MKDLGDLETDQNEISSCHEVIMSPYPTHEASYAPGCNRIPWQRGAACDPEAGSTERD